MARILRHRATSKILGAAAAFGLVACSPDPSPAEPPSGDGGTIDDALPGTTPPVGDAPATEDGDASDTLLDALVDDGSDRVTYGGKRTVKTAWGCAVVWTPTSVASPITVGGVAYPLNVVAEFCPPDSGMLDPLKASTSLNLTTNVGIWSLRFRTPKTTGAFQMTFLAYGGDTSATAGRTSIARLPGEYHDDGRKNSFAYCELPSSNSVYLRVTDALDSTSTVCQLQKDTVYYFNALVPTIDPRGNSSLFGWTSGF